MEKCDATKLTLEDGQKAASAHALERGYQVRQKYGKFIDYETLLEILKDDEFVRYPTQIKFDSAGIDSGMFGFAQRVSKDINDGYVIYIHDFFENKKDDVPALVLYHVVCVNYGDFATHNESEEFASSALGMEKEDYYQYICRLADSIPKD